MITFIKENYKIMNDGSFLGILKVTCLYKCLKSQKNTAFLNYDMTQIVLVRKVGQSDGHSDQILNVEKLRFE